jgi:SAM-dependent methyltransferase
MIIKEISPPRNFKVGINHKITISDCGTIFLNPDEQVTFITDSGGEYDVAKKDWGFYATPSINGRLKTFNLKTALVSNKDRKLYIMLVETKELDSFNKYLKEEALNLEYWLDEETDQNRSNIQGDTCCIFCSGSEYDDVFNFKKPPKLETIFNLTNLTDYQRKIISCKVCNHMYSTHTMDLQSLYSGEYNQSTYKNLEGMNTTFQKIINLPHEKSDNWGRGERINTFIQSAFPEYRSQELKLLDIGSGLGVFPWLMKNNSYKVTALDPDSNAIEHIKNNVGVSTIIGDFLKLDITEKYNIITLNKVLEHVYNPIEMLSKAKNCLESDGVIYVEVPDGEVAMKDGEDREEFVIDHIHIFSLSSLTLMANKSGLEIVEIERLQEPSTKYTLRAFLRNQIER